MLLFAHRVNRLTEVLGDVKLVMHEVGLTLEPLYKKSPYQLALDLPDAVTMDSFAGALGQLITNFVSNALQHGFEGRASPLGRYWRITSAPTGGLN